VKGLIDFADIWTAAEVARAIANMSKGHGMVAGTIHGMKSLYKHLNNPNRAIKNMFSEMDDIMVRKP
jgi:hypothetical protein